MYNCILIVEKTNGLSNSDLKRIHSILQTFKDVHGAKVTTRESSVVVWYLLIDRKAGLDVSKGIMNDIRDKFERDGYNNFLFYNTSPLMWTGYGSQNIIDTVAQYIDEMKSTVELIRE